MDVKPKKQGAILSKVNIQECKMQALNAFAAIVLDR